MISRIFAYLTEALVAVGFLGLVTKRVRFTFDVEHFVLTTLSVGFLAALILVPGLANTMNMTRFYHVLLFFLAPLCVLGAETIVNVVSKRNMEVKVTILIFVVLVPYFLFQTGFVYEVTGNDSWSVPLSEYRMNALRLYGQLGYSTVYSVFGARWLSKNIDVDYTQIYADSYSRMNELRVYGRVYLGYVEVLSNTTEVRLGGLLYLSSLNIIQGIVVGGEFSWNLSELQFSNDLSKIYSNGGSEVYKDRP